MNAAVVGVKEVTAIRNALRTSGAQGALGPARGTQPPTVLPEFTDMVDCVQDTVFDTGRPSRNQPSAAADFLFAHGTLDARRGR